MGLRIACNKSSLRDSIERKTVALDASRGLALQAFTGNSHATSCQARDRAASGMVRFQVLTRLSVVIQAKRLRKLALLIELNK